MQFKYIDVHSHPNLSGLKEDQDAVIARMKEEGVLGIVVGVDLESSREAVRLAQKHEHLYATVGLHPNYTNQEDFNRIIYDTILQEEKVVGVGECGLDYFRQSTTKVGEEAETGWKEKQWEVFKQQVELAIKHDMPLMIHCRPSKGSMDAYEEVATYLESIVLNPGLAQGGVRGNMHFFVGTVEVAKRFWRLGFTTSFTGVLTFTHDYDDVVREAPLDMILTETDAPYATPAPHRGKVNQPVYVEFVTKKIAELKGESLETVQQTVLDNAKRLFNV